MQGEIRVVCGGSQGHLQLLALEVPGAIALGQAQLAAVGEVTLALAASGAGADVAVTRITASATLDVLVAGFSNGRVEAMSASLRGAGLKLGSQEVRLILVFTAVCALISCRKPRAIRPSLWLGTGAIPSSPC